MKYTMYNNKIDIFETCIILYCDKTKKVQHKYQI